MKRAARSTRVALECTRPVALLLFVAAISTTALAADEATITQLVNEVRFHAAQATLHSASVNDTVPDGNSVQTGINSRAELTFQDRAVARLSANTIFTFNKGIRNLDLADGAVLLCAPKAAGDAKISTGAVTAAIAGTTVIVEYHPHACVKFISLEGTVRLYLKRRWGESVLLRPGQMLFTNPEAKSLPDPVDIDLDRLLKTSRLIVDFPALGSQNSIAKEIERQRRAKSKKNMVDTNLVIFGKGTVVSLTNPAQMGKVVEPTAGPTIPGWDAIPASADVGTVETAPAPRTQTPDESHSR